MFDIFKKFLKKPQPKEIETSHNLSESEGLLRKSEKVRLFLNESALAVKNEIISIKEKTKDLHQTNFDLGIRHLENGNLSEAVFRFRFIKKFWPDDYNAYYQLAYCLILQEKPKKARRVLEELLEKNPEFDPEAQELLERLNQVIGDE